MKHFIAHALLAFLIYGLIAFGVAQSIHTSSSGCDQQKKDCKK